MALSKSQEKNALLSLSKVYTKEQFAIIIDILKERYKEYLRYKKIIDKWNTNVPKRIWNREYFTVKYDRSVDILIHNVKSDDPEAVCSPLEMKVSIGLGDGKSIKFKNDTNSMDGVRSDDIKEVINIFEDFYKTNTEWTDGR